MSETQGETTDGTTIAAVPDEVVAAEPVAEVAPAAIEAAPGTQAIGSGYIGMTDAQMDGQMPVAPEDDGVRPWHGQTNPLESLYQWAKGEFAVLKGEKV